VNLRSLLVVAGARAGLLQKKGADVCNGWAIRKNGQMRGHLQEQHAVGGHPGSKEREWGELASTAQACTITLGLRIIDHKQDDARPRRSRGGITEQCGQAARRLIEEPLGRQGPCGSSAAVVVPYSSH
jgi:hypothetical protein